MSDFLQENHIKARPFHRGLKGHALDDTLKKWLKGDIDCVVATIAFGMVRDYRLPLMALANLVMIGD